MILKPNKTRNERKTIAQYLHCMAAQLILLYDLAAMTNEVATSEPDPLVEAVTLDGDIEKTICAAEAELVNFFLKTLPTNELYPKEETRPIPPQ